MTAWYEAPAAGSRAAGAAASWQLLDYATARQSVTAAGGAVLSFPLVPESELWQITRAVVSSTSSAASSCRLYLDSTGNDPLSGTNSGNFDEADYPGDGLWVPATRQLLVAWSGVTDGASCTASIQYRRLRRG